MSRPRRPELRAEAARRNAELLARLGKEVRDSRRRRRLSQRLLASLAYLSQSTMSRLERGLGGSFSLDAWQRVFTALDRPLSLVPSRDAMAETTDAGHLAMQELVLKTVRGAGWNGSFELPIRPAGGVTRHSIDVGIRHDRLRVLGVLELWNTFDDLGASRRSFAWKLGRAEELAAAIGDGRPYRIAGCWIVRATRRNRQLVTTYPTLFRSAFDGSSIGWVRSLTVGTEPPTEPGLIWCDVAARRLFASRPR
jgi:transcriptional regulator with XRE-family HTH domain